MPNEFFNYIPLAIVMVLLGALMAWAKLTDPERKHRR